MSPRSRALRATFAAGFLLTTALGAGVANAQHLSMYGLTTENRLIRFNPTTPSELTLNVKIGGLRSGETLIGLDKRPADGKLYSVGKLGTSGWLYTIDGTTGAASLVTELFQAGTTNPRLPIALNGTEFGFDFNPAADALRIISDTGQNLRALPSSLNPAGVPRVMGDTFSDGTLSYSPIAVSPRPAATGITAAAYTNSDTDPATGTTLHDLDTTLDDLVIQNPPNDGTLAKVADIGAPTGILAGFDIRTIDGTNTAFASLTRQVGNGVTHANLYLVDLATGAVTDLGRIGGPKALRDIAAA